MTAKTEAPTPRRLKQARERGDSGVSAAATQSVTFAVVVLGVLPFAARRLLETATHGIVAATSSSPSTSLTELATLEHRAAEALALVVSLSFPVLLAALLVSAVATMVQTGGAVALSRLAPDASRLNPVRGLAELATPTRLFATVRALLVASAICAIVVTTLRDHLPDLMALVRLPARGSLAALSVAAVLAQSIASWAVALGLGLGAADLALTRRGWMARLRMTKAEVQREHKESEGDPALLAARKRAHEELLAAANAGAVKGATVVIVNPTHLATALHYDSEGESAPVILASGEGVVAEAIVRAARDFGVPVVRDVPLAHALRTLEEGAEIPEALYEAVAEILREILVQREDLGR